MLTSILIPFPLKYYKEFVEKNNTSARDQNQLFYPIHLFKFTYSFVCVCVCVCVYIKQKLINFIRQNSYVLSVSDIKHYNI